MRIITDAEVGSVLDLRTTTDQLDRAFADLGHRRAASEGTNVALFWVDGAPYALQNTCIHKKRHLVKGTILGNRIVCPGHQWAFDLDTGYEKSQDACQPTFRVRLEHDHVYLHPTSRVVVEDTSWEPGLNR